MNDPTAPICDCELPVFPLVIQNLPSLSAISYRVGDYGGFRDALLRGLPGEVELRAWTPAPGDLALQLVEWWAYLSDILTFYSEQAANNAYLRTAFLPGTVERLVQILGYRPRPGVGAKGTLAAILAPTTAGTVTIPVGFAVQSKPGPGQTAQTFELDSASDVVLSVVPPIPVGAVPAAPALPASISSVLMKGSVSSVHANDLLYLASAAQPSDSYFPQVTVQGVGVELDPQGVKNTRVYFTQPVTIQDDVTSLALYRTVQSMNIFPYLGYTAGATTGGSQTTDIHLASIARSIHVGDPIVLYSPGSAAYEAAQVSAYSEQVWYMNGDGGDPSVAPSSGPISAPHTVLSLDVDVSSLGVTSILYGLRSVGTIIADPITTLAAGTGLTIQTSGAPPASLAEGTPVIVEDTTGNGALSTIGSAPTTLFDGSVQASIADPLPAALEPPLDLLLALLPVSRGKTVSKEVIGSGDATAAGQVFSLQNSPLTYFPGGDASFPTSTLQVSVNGIRWTEVKSFYGQAPDAQVFVTRQAIDQTTQVIFGDGANGARLPTGSGNVVASYRYGSGKASPPAGALTTILKPQPGLRSLRNPVAVSGGDDPAPSDQVRAYAPASVLTFGRAISASDYEAIAAQAPAVARAKAFYDWDAGRQRALVNVYVGDDDAAVASAKHALDSARDQNLPAKVVRAIGTDLVVTFSLEYDPRWDPDAVTAAVTLALVDPDAGLFAAKQMGIGQPLYESQLVAACLAIPGAVAVHALSFARSADGSSLPGPRIVPDAGAGGFFTLSSANLDISVEAANV